MHRDLSPRSRFVSRTGTTHQSRDLDQRTVKQNFHRKPADNPYVTPMPPVRTSCRPCDVEWHGMSGSTCWLCGQPGTPTYPPVPSFLPAPSFLSATAAAAGAAAATAPDTVAVSTVAATMPTSSNPDQRAPGTQGVQTLSTGDMYR